MKNYANLNDNIRELEREYIALALRYGQTFASKLVPEDFFFFGHVYRVLQDSWENEKNISLELKTQGISATEFVNYETSRTLSAVARDLRASWKSRRVHDILGRALEQLPNQDTDSLIAEIQGQLIEGVSQERVEHGSIDNVIEEYRERQKLYHDKFKNGGGIIGLSTGYGVLDEMFDGLRPEHFIIIGGYTSTGKTAASLNFVSELVKQKKRVVYYSLEMAATDILSRLLGIMTNQSGLAILKKIPHDEGKVEEALKLLSESRMALYTSISELNDLSLSMTEENLRAPVDLFVVDFLQLVTAKGSKSEYEATSQVALTLQKIAKRLKVPVIALSQISNEGARAGDSAVMSFKGSGHIASAADVAIEIVSAESDIDSFRTKLKDGQPVNMKWVVRKNRHGRVGSLLMTFQGRTGVFELSEFEKL